MSSQQSSLDAPLGASRPSKAVFGSDVMVEVLRELGVKYIALNPGASYRGFHDSLVNFGEGGPEMILCTHEEIAVAIANGYARVTGKPMATGLHNVVGLQHAAMAIFNAWCDRTPMINLGGGGPQDTNHRRSTDWVHSALVQGNAVRDYVKHDDQPFSIESVPESFLRAYRIATTEPKGPVYITLDADVQEDEVTTPMWIPDASLYQAPSPPAANADALRDATELIVNADWPVIIAGEVGLKPGMPAALQDLAELLGAPVVDAGGPFNIPNGHPLDVTEAREEALKDADVVLALDVPSLGVPLGPSVRERGALVPAIGRDTKIIHITLSDMEKQSWVTDNMWLFPVQVAIAADTAQALPELLIMTRELMASDPANRQRAEGRRAKAEAMHNEARKRGADFIAKSWDEYPISGPRLWGEIGQRVKGQDWALVQSHGRRWRELIDLTEPGHGLGGGRGAGLGYGMPAAIGSALAYKGTGKLCIAVLGDGDFFMTSNALWTAAKYDIPLLTILYNNRSYYNDEEHQERVALRRDRPVENKGIGVQINDPIPDFASLAMSLSVASWGPIENPADIGPALDAAIAVVRSGKPAFVDVVTQSR
jgi:acetolactate synthase-1/2/3 large subunit